MCSHPGGCSREEFNGDYVQQEGEFYYRRPIFFCAEQEKYLFYHGKRRLGPKASKANTPKNRQADYSAAFFSGVS